MSFPLTTTVKSLLIGLLTGLAFFLALAVSGPQNASAAEASCPKFRVMHNDRIGKLSLPAGWYDVTVLNGDRLSCAQASKLFAQFLQDWDGVLPKPWVLDVKRQEFRRGRTDVGFRVSKGTSSGGDTGGGGTSASCPGYVIVGRKDRIGSFTVPRGPYRVTLLSSKGLSCARAKTLFQIFLKDFDGVLPRPWKLDPESATFYRGNNKSVGFHINRAYGPSPAPHRDQKFDRCPATFRVLHNDRIGKLSLPAGPYYIHVEGGLSCSAASNYFRQFLMRTDGKLPSPWRLNAKKALFKGPGGQGFQVQQA